VYIQESFGRSEQFRELLKKLTKENNRLHDEIQFNHVSFFQRWIERKIEFIGLSENMIQENPDLTINELANMLDNRIEREARKLNKIKTFEKREKVYNNLSALEWVRNVVRAVELEYRQ
jgi:hypothetical protein